MALVFFELGYAREEAVVLTGITIPLGVVQHLKYLERRSDREWRRHMLTRRTSKIMRESVETMEP